MNFICGPCKEIADHPKLTLLYPSTVVEIKRQPHLSCRGGTWCDCQHRIGHK